MEQHNNSATQLVITCIAELLFVSSRKDAKGGEDLVEAKNPLIFPDAPQHAQTDQSNGTRSCRPIRVLPSRFEIITVR